MRFMCESQIQSLALSKALSKSKLHLCKKNTSQYLVHTEFSRFLHIDMGTCFHKFL